MPPRKASGSRRQHSAPVLGDYPGRIGGKGMDESHWRACRDILESIYDAKDGPYVAIFAFIIRSPTSTEICSVSISDIFRELPDKDEYADYYHAITDPECLDHVASQLASQGFSSPEKFFSRLHLVFLNAKYCTSPVEKSADGEITRRSRRSGRTRRNSRWGPPFLRLRKIADGREGHDV
jgi:chromatin structure-remodeling complex subunit RSC1/2